MKNTEIESLIYLLEDPDPFVKQNVVDRLITLGEQVIPILDEYRVKSNDETREGDINNILHTITFDSIEQEFMNLVDSGIETVRDLEEGAFLLARLETPTLRTEVYRRKLDEMADALLDNIKYTVDPIEQMRILLHYVFYEENFNGAEDEYFDPANSYINRVLERKVGIPISLALVVLFLAERLNLPVFGVNMPMHFLLKYQNETEQIFIDPFHKGKIVSMNQCAYFLKMNGVKPESYYFDNAHPRDILARNIRNLIHSYEKKDDIVRVDSLKKLLNYIELTFGDSDTSTDTHDTFGA